MSCMMSAGLLGRVSPNKFSEYFGFLRELELTGILSSLTVYPPFFSWYAILGSAYTFICNAQKLIIDKISAFI